MYLSKVRVFKVIIIYLHIDTVNDQTYRYHIQLSNAVLLNGEGQRNAVLFDEHGGDLDRP